MRNLILFCFSLIISITTIAQHPLTSQQKARAHKKAIAETFMYKKKGFKVYESSANMQSLIEGFYQNAYKEYKPGQRVYVWAMGLGKASTATHAVNIALQKAKKHIPGLMLMYFNSWTSANSKLSGSDKKLIMNAINNAKSGITNRIMARNPEKSIRLIKTRKGQYQAAVRVLYKQFPLRVLARNEIKKNLRKTTNWSESKMDKLLHFEK